MVRMTPGLAARRAVREAEKRARWKTQAAEQKARWAERDAELEAELEATHAGRMIHDFLLSEECKRTVDQHEAKGLLNRLRHHGAKIWNVSQYNRFLGNDLPEGRHRCTPEGIAAGLEWHWSTPEDIAAGLETTATIWWKYRAWADRGGA